MARKYSKHGPREDLYAEEEPPHPVPKSRGGRDVVPMHPICQQTLIANFTNSELQRHAMDVEALLANSNVRKFVDWVAKKDPDFNAATTKKQR